MTLWTVVTVTYNSADHLRRHWKDRDRSFHWIVVDNGSTDDTVAIAAALADEVIHSGGNVGFSAANNLGLDASKSEYTMFVNPDVTIDGGDWQSILASVAEAQNALVGPQLLNSDESEQPNARGIPFLAAKVRHRLRSSGSHDQYSRTLLGTTTYCAWLMGAAVGGKTERLRSLGGWDQKYFLYYEDHEFGLRAWQHGMRVAVVPAVRWHHGWERATLKPSPRAWRAELASMRRFYWTYPWLILASRGSRRSNQRRFGELTTLLWSAAPARGAVR